MIEMQGTKINEEVILPQQFVDETWKKYNKRMHDIIDDVEIESEIEAEKKIRSKNSRLVTISIISFALLMLIFTKVQQYSSISQAKVDIKNKPEETTLNQRKTQPVNSRIAQAANALTTSTKKFDGESVKHKDVSTAVNERFVQKSIQSEKNSKQVSENKTMSGVGKKYYVQLGLFSIKTNAEKFFIKVRSKGFNTVLNVQDTKSNQYQVFVGNFSEKNSSEKIKADLKSFGFTPLIKKFNNTYTLNLGTFQNKNNSNSFIKKLRDHGFKPKVKKFLTADKTYAVRIEGLENKDEALKTRQRLVEQGFKNSFIRQL